MSVSQPPVPPLSDDDLSALPVFPLPRAVFFPGSLLPLHLFEPRYRSMMEDCVESGPLAMAVALLEPGYEEDYAGRPPVHTIAGAGRILEHRRHPDGRFDLLLRGLHRVRLEELPSDRPYRRARATIAPDRVPHPEAVERLRTPVLTLATEVARAIRRKHADFTLDIAPETTPAQLADRIADRLVPDVAQRQRLLEALDVKVRLALCEEALVDLLARLS